MNIVAHYLKKMFFTLLITCLGVAHNACTNDPPLPDNLSAFEATQLGMSESEKELTIKVFLTRAADVDIPLTVGVFSEGIAYGDDFFTVPAADADQLSLIIPKGSNEVSFRIIKADGLLLDGDEKITFTLHDVAKPAVMGLNKTLTLSFSEILSEGAIVDINGGGALYKNKVFIDLSANRQTAVDRNSWDLGFYMGDEDFKVILNSSVTMMARPIEKNDLNEVTESDTLGFAYEMIPANAGALPWIDSPTGDLNGTAIKGIYADAASNMVYIVNRGGTSAPSRGWKKIRVIRDGSGYTLQYAAIHETSFQEIHMDKDDAYLFKYVSFENGVIEVEPRKDKWDIAWTYFMNTTSLGAGTVPYGFQDIVLQNRYGVETAKVLTQHVAYEAFTEADLSAIAFSSNQLAIGPDWRRTSPSPAIVYDDRFYIIKDADGNYYKLRFNAILKDGVRGTPQVEYALVKTMDNRQ